jgi:hypothetical protein
MACISLFLSRVPFSLFDLRSPKLLDLAITKTIDQVIVYPTQRSRTFCPVRKDSVLLSAEIATTFKLLP